MPTNYAQINDYSDELGTTHGLHLDEDFTSVASSIASVTESLALVQRGDGRLQDVSVEIHTLSQDVLNLLGGFNLRGLWATATAYAVNDIVSEGEYTYACKTEHTSGGAFDGAYWNQFGFTDGAASAYLRPVLKNCIINGNFQVNQRAYVAGAAELEEDVLLGRKVHINAGGGQPGAGGDVPGGRRVKTLVGEGRCRGIEQPAGCFADVRPERARGRRHVDSMPHLCKTKQALSQRSICDDQAPDRPDRARSGLVRADQG